MRFILGGACVLAAAVWACGSVYEGSVAPATDGGAGDGSGPRGDEPTPPGTLGDAGGDGGEVPGGDGGPDLPAGPVLDDAYTAGSRLQPNFVTLGAQRVFVDWWDTKLKYHCDFKTLGGGYRCVPKVPQFYNSYFDYVDAACSQIGIDLSPCYQNVPTYIEISDGCGGSRIAKVGPLATAHYSKPGQSCFGGYSTSSFYSIVDLDPNDLVRGVLSDGTEDLGTPLKAQYVTGDDGARGFFQLVPRKYPTTACEFAPGYADSVLRCFPVDFLQASDTFADSGCTKPYFTFYGSYGPGCTPKVPPGFGQHRAATTDACATNDGKAGDFYEIGNGSSGSAWTASGATCTKTGSTGNYTGATKIDPSVLGSATRLEIGTNDGLVMALAVMPSGHRVKLGFSDPAHGGDCTFGPGSDGSFHCFPTAANAPIAAFSDSTCSASRNAVYSATNDMTACRRGQGNLSCTSPCTPPPAPSFAVQSSSTYGGVCLIPTATRRLYSVDASFTAYLKLGASQKCTQLTQANEAVYGLTEVSPLTLSKALVSYP